MYWILFELDGEDHQIMLNWERKLRPRLLKEDAITPVCKPIYVVHENQGPWSILGYHCGYAHPPLLCGPGSALDNRTWGCEPYISGVNLTTYVVLSSPKANHTNGIWTISIASRWPSHKRNQKDNNRV